MIGFAPIQGVTDQRTVRFAYGGLVRALKPVAHPVLELHHGHGIAMALIADEVRVQATERESVISRCEAELHLAPPVQSATANAERHGTSVPSEGSRDLDRVERP